MRAIASMSWNHQVNAGDSRAGHRWSAAPHHEQASLSRPLAAVHAASFAPQRFGHRTRQFRRARRPLRRAAMAVQKTASRAPQVGRIAALALLQLADRADRRRLHAPGGGAPAERRESAPPIPLAAITMISGKRNQAHRRSGNAVRTALDSVRAAPYLPIGAENARSNRERLSPG